MWRGLEGGEIKTAFGSGAIRTVLDQRLMIMGSERKALRLIKSQDSVRLNIWIPYRNFLESSETANR
jgi:hypothetical protein